MKLLFAGPSIFGLDIDLGTIELRPPARRDAVAAAVDAGATAIGLVDGYYEQVPSVWHKEILYALSQGVHVLGAASMGALRAAECEAFGMVPVGEIAARYCSGELCDDDAVALLNAPAELGYMPLTEPLVDVDATFARLVELNLVTADEASDLESTAHRIFFKDRTDSSLFAAMPNRARAEQLLAAYREHHVGLKTRDAAALLDLLARLPDERTAAPEWRLAASPFWRQRGGPELALVS